MYTTISGFAAQTMARAQTVKAAIGKSNAKFATSWANERVPDPTTIFFRQASGGTYGNVVAAVTDTGRPCALLLDPEAKLSRSHYMADLQRRFPATVKLSEASESSAITDIVDVTLDRLLGFAALQQAGAPAEYAAEAALLQQQSILYGSTFQRSVWRAMAQVPLGKTCSYGELARRAGHDVKSTRAVAQACGANPLTLVVPCHRIVAQGGGMGGYHWGTTVKQKILRDEARIVKPKSMTLLRSI